MQQPERYNGEVPYRHTEYVTSPLTRLGDALLLSLVNMVRPVVDKLIPRRANSDPSNLPEVHAFSTCFGAPGIAQFNAIDEKDSN